ncbi:MAG: aminofutalosine synthase MqnE [Acidobacteriota bacterium]
MLRETIEKSGLADINDKVANNERLTREDGLRLYAATDLNVLGYMANRVRERRNGQKAFFVRNQHINYTNVCNKGCKFCAFYVLPGADDAYTLSPDQVRQRVRDWLKEPITEIHMVAGINPRLPYDYYLDILRAVKEIRPTVRIKAFTMIEMVEIQRVARKPIEEVLEDLKDAGLDSVPGGGVEVLSDRVHEEIFRLKLSPAGWLDMARKVHMAGLKSNATLLYGHIETPKERVDHFLRLRELQDETGGFLAFIPLAFHPDNTEMDNLPSTTGFEDLRQIAVSRLMLDNFPHIKSFWIMISPPVSQVSLWYGADDVDGTILREEITHSAGATTPQALTRNGLVEMIREAGRIPVERDPLYQEVSHAA